MKHYLLLLSLPFICSPFGLIKNEVKANSAPTNVKWMGRAKNVNDGYIANASVSIDGVEKTKTDDFGAFSIKLSDEDLNKKLTISSLGYETFEKDISSISNLDLGEVSLNYPFSSFGKTKFKTTDIYNDWIGYLTRGLSSLHFKFVSPYQRFYDSNSLINLLIDTGDVKSQLGEGDYQFKLYGDKNLFVYDLGNPTAKTEISQFNYRGNLNDNGTELYLDIPYSFLGIDYTEVIGLCFQDILIDRNVVADFYFNEKVVPSDDPTAFAKVDKKGKAFLNNTNSYNPLWISDAEVRRLTEGYMYNFSGNKYCANKNADEVYFNYEYKEDALSLSFLGFGYFEDDEYFKMVIHSDEYAYYGWNISTKDSLINIKKTSSEIYTNLSTFFDVESYRPIPTYRVNHIYREFGNYFTINLDISWSLIETIKNVKQGFRFAIAEFGDNNIYAPIDPTNYIRNNRGTKLGDIAGMNSYIQVASPFDKITISDEAKEDLIVGRNLSFSNPNDTKIIESDDLYLKSSRDEEAITLDFVGFGNFQVYETIKIVLHNNADELQSDWHIHKNDISLLINKERCLIRKNRTWFFDLNTMSSKGTVSTNSPIYEEHDEYFTIKLVLPYADLSSVFKTAEISALFLQMDFLGNVYNGGTNLNAMRLNGMPTGDPAQQSSYALLSF